MPPQSDLLTTALAYAEHGWSVLPCKPNGKLPLTASGCSAATTDPDTITRWWGNWPQANIGIHAGRSGLVIVDADTPEAVEWLLKQPDTLRATTGRGLHAYYAAPEGVEISPTSGTIRQSIDTRAGNSYVVAPPSTHHGGRSYEFLNHLHPAPLPDVFRRKPATPAPEGGWRDPAPARVRVRDRRLAMLLSQPGPRGDVSAGDFAIACEAVRLEHTDAEIAALLESHRRTYKAKRKSSGYLARTIARARQAVR